MSLLSFQKWFFIKQQLQNSNIFLLKKILKQKFQNLIKFELNGSNESIFSTIMKFGKNKHLASKTLK
jgi:hypothetical protein